MIKSNSQPRNEFPLNSTEIRWLGAILAAAFGVRMLHFVFFSNYATKILGDDWWYLHRAKQYFNGDIFSLEQWSCFPRMTHVLMAQIFKLLYFFRLDEYRVESVLIFFNLFAVVSGIFVYLIAREVSKNRTLSLLASGLYVFSYPIIYINSFLLSENFVIPLLPIVCWGVFFSKTKLECWLVGILLGLTASVRPNAGILLIPFAGYIIFSRNVSRASVWQALFFLFGFFLVIFSLIVENNYVSRGELRSLSPNGGYSFFIQHCRPYETISTSSPYRHIIHASLSKSPELGTFVTDRQWHDQAYFFKLGLQCLREKPWILIENLKEMRLLFSGPSWPYDPAIKGFSFFYPLFSFITLVFTLALPLIFFVRMRDGAQFKKILLMISIPFFFSIPLYFFTVEERYFWPCLFAVYVAFFAMLPHLRSIKKTVFIYAMIFAVLFAGSKAANGIREHSLMKAYGSKSVRILALEDFKEPKKSGTPWNAYGNLIMIPRENPVLLESKNDIAASEFEISADCNDVYVLNFYKGKEFLGSAEVPEMVLSPECGLEKRALPMPDALKGKKFNKILIRVKSGDNYCSVGHLTFR